MKQPHNISLLVPSTSEEAETESDSCSLHNGILSQGFGLVMLPLLLHRRRHQHPSISHEWSNPFCQSTSWPKGGESARFPVCLVLTSWPWACLGACRAKLKAGGNLQELALSWMGAGIHTWPWELCNPYSWSWGSKDLAKGATCLPDLFWSVRQGHQLMPPEPFSLVTSEFSNVKH